MKFIILMLLSVFFALGCKTTNNDDTDFIEGKYVLEFTGFFDTKITGYASFDIIGSESPTSHLALQGTGLSEFEDNILITSGPMIPVGKHKYCLDDFLDDEDLDPCLDDTGTFWILFDDQEEGYFLWCELEVIESSDTIVRATIYGVGAGGLDEESFTMQGTIYALRENSGD